LLLNEFNFNIINKNITKGVKIPSITYPIINTRPVKVDVWVKLYGSIGSIYVK